MSSGELSFESPPSRSFTWSIPDFLELTDKSRYSIWSPDFTFADGRHCLRMYEIRDSTCNDMGIELVTLSEHDPRGVLYEVVVKSPTGEIHFDPDEDNRNLFRLNRSDFEDEEDECVDDGTLTVLCSMRSREPGSAVSSKSGGARTRLIPSKRRTGNLSSESFRCLYVVWRIPAFFRVAGNRRRTMLCPEFPFSDHLYRLRLFPSKGGNNVHIHLVNTSDPVPGRYVSYDVGLKSTSGEEIVIEVRGPSSKRNFYIPRSELDDKQPVHFPDGHLTVFCCMRSREPTSGGSSKSSGAETLDEEKDQEALPDHIYKMNRLLESLFDRQSSNFIDSLDTSSCQNEETDEPNESEWSDVSSSSEDSSDSSSSDNEEATEPSFRACSIMTIGELSFESPTSLSFTWSIPDFFRLTGKSGYSLWSHDYGRLCLRMYEMSDLHCDYIRIELVNSTEPDPRRADLYKVVLKSATGELHFDRDVNSREVFRLRRRDLEGERDEYVHDGTLTVLCSVLSREPGIEESSKSGGARTRVIPTKRTGNLSIESFRCLYVTWRIPAYFRLAGESRRTLLCPEFPFSDHRYRLRLFPSQNGNNVHFHLVNSTDPVPGRYVSYKVGLKSTSGEEIDIEVYGPSTKRNFYIPRSELDDKKPVHFPDGHLTVFCFIRSREPSSARSPKPGGAATWVEEKDQEALSVSGYRRMMGMGLTLMPQLDRHSSSIKDSSVSSSSHNEEAPEPKVPNIWRLSYSPRSSLWHKHGSSIKDSSGSSSSHNEKAAEPISDYRSMMPLYPALKPQLDRHSSNIKDSSVSSSSHNEEAAEPKIPNFGRLPFFPRNNLPRNTGSSIKDYSGSSSSHNEKAAEPISDYRSMMPLCPAFEPQLDRHSRSIKDSSVSSSSHNEEAPEPSCRPPFTVKSGDLSFDSPRSLGVTWNITDFFRHTTESAYSIQCLRFTFADGRYCLRLSSSGNNKEFVDIQLVNLTDTVFDRYVWYEVGLKSTTGKEIDIGQFRASSTRKFRIRRDELDKKKSECFPDGHLTVFCCMRSREPNNAGNPNSGGAQSHLFPGSNDAAHPKSIAVQTSNAEEDKEALRGVDQLQFKYKYLVLAA